MHFFLESNLGRVSIIRNKVFLCERNIFKRQQVDRHFRLHSKTSLEKQDLWLRIFNLKKKKKKLIDFVQAVRIYCRADKVAAVLHILH